MEMDLCCGTKKRPGAFGVDRVQLPGIDLVHNLDVTPWPIPSNSVSDILCEHGIEHVNDVIPFLKECHRILKPGGQLTIVCPHFSSFNSYSDPTHKRHLSAFWFKPFLKNGYLASKDIEFDLASTTVTFGRGLRAKLGQLLVALRGLEKWEKNAAFRYPGIDIKTVLQARKS